MIPKRNNKPSPAAVQTSIHERIKRREGNLTPAEVKKANEKFFAEHPGKAKGAKIAEEQKRKNREKINAQHKFERTVRPT